MAIKKIIFNKLVRDSIEVLLLKQKCIVFSKRLSVDAYAVALNNKIYEEIEELCRAETLSAKEEELADVYEVLDEFIRLNALDRTRIDAVKNKKRLEKGGFDQRVFIESIQYEEGNGVDVYFTKYQQSSNKE